MSYWLREIAGWLLVLSGLFIFLLVYDYCERLRVFDAAVMAVVGIFVFRGGIQLLKVAVAARVCRQLQDQAFAPRTVEPSRAVTQSR